MAASLTIAIPTYQRRQSLARLLDSIAAAVAVSSIDAAEIVQRVEVIVVLDGSTDGSFAMVSERSRTFPVLLHHLWQPNRGLSAARNAAIDACTTDLVWLVDDDMTIGATALDRHVLHDRSTSDVLMGPCHVVERAPGSIAGAPEQRAFYEERHQRLSRVGIVDHPRDCTFANTSAPVTALRVHRFDESYRGYGMEDYDLAARLLEVGVVMGFDPDAGIEHHAVPTRGERLRKLREEGANRVRFVQNHAQHADAAFVPQPARFERFVRWTTRPRMAGVLWKAALAIETTRRLPPVSKMGDRLGYWADTCAVYSGASRPPQRRPAISFVIPAHNASATIGRTLGSLIAQSDGGWEAIVVDDGSTDDTAEIVERLAAKDPRIQLHHQGQHGASSARNVGAFHARTEWLVFLDADDWVMPEYVLTMADALERDVDVDGVRCGWAYEHPVSGRLEAGRDTDLDAGHDLFAIASRRCPFAIHACVVRRSLVIEVGCFDPQLVIGEDWDLWQRIARCGARLAAVPDVLAVYTLRPTSLMHQSLTRILYDSLAVYRRGHSHDLRVPTPRADVVLGAPERDDVDVVGEMVAWCGALGVVNGIDVSDLLPRRRIGGGLHLDPRIVAGTLFESVPFALCRLTDEWPQVWREFEPRIVHSVESLSEWSEHPELVPATLRSLERMIAVSATSEESWTVGHTHVVRVDMITSPPVTVVPPAVVERVVVMVYVSGDGAGIVDVPVLGDTVTADEIDAAIRAELGPRLVRMALRRRRLALDLLPGFRAPLRRRWPLRWALDVPWGTGCGEITARFARAAALCIADRGDPAAPPAGADVPSTNAPAMVSEAVPASGDSPEEGAGEEYFESIFHLEDPWTYTSEYEQLKYEQTLGLIAGLDASTAVELACAEGHFTVQLAPMVGHLIAADIAPTALERAARRCAELDNIEFRHLDLRHDALPCHVDLVVCSEVLYYLDDEAALSELGCRFAEALVPGGHLVTAHANTIADDPTSTGFYWDHRLGARRIGQVLASVPGLALRREIITDLYRIQLFERVTDASEPEAPRIERADRSASLDADLARMVAWNGIEITRGAAIDTELSPRLPILMYHRVTPESCGGDLARYAITPDEFEAQLDHLRRHGFYGITPDRWSWALSDRRTLPGRAVMFTFDDGYADFYSHAWPLLEAYGFSATVFLVIDEIGGSANWDAHHGVPSPLLAWEQVLELRDRGVHFGSHTVAHRSLTSETPKAALWRERDGRESLEHRLQRPVVAMAYPFGSHDAVVRRTMVAAGYRMAFTSDPGYATVWDDPMALKRIEIIGGQGLEAFAAALPRPVRHNPLRAAVTRARAVTGVR